MASLSEEIHVGAVENRPAIIFASQVIAVATKSVSDWKVRKPTGLTSERRAFLRVIRAQVDQLSDLTFAAAKMPRRLQVNVLGDAKGLCFSKIT